ncbi:protein TAPETUM DETERMINANT 1-like [Cucurbita maxima]|uniref:Protein TAPETUM DETERMINANT 1-like n=1 Tax=Cucurbita maxima TaxID=3661 RepID=A0A6J1KP98_CUCMA|nr:protein TAPETUM DETERMINANT 1-like [Cucurbita maxima]
MAPFAKLFAALLFVSLLHKGNCQCVSNDIAIRQTMSGFQIHGMTEWNVTISNICLCSQSEVKLDCRGFQTTKSIDPSVLAVTDSECLVNNGLPIFKSNSITFTYAHDPKFDFKLISSQINCS